MSNLKVKTILVSQPEPKVDNSPYHDLQNKFKVNQFGILPGYEKEFKYDLPKELAKGNYSGLCVLDYGDKEALQTAEIDFKIE